MTNIIWKYELPRKTQFTMEMPKNAKILSLQLQNGKPCLWVVFDTKEKATKQPRKFYIMGTGIEFDNRMSLYVGTYQQEGRIWHLFEVISIGAKIAEILH